MIKRLQFVTLALLSFGAVSSTVASAATSACTTTSRATVPTVIELYTSEGCNSCPPADQWLSQTVARTSVVKDNNVIPLAFHVDYWDYIGWKDAFAQPAFSQRQTTLVRTSGASGVYTPQIFVNGKDDRSWTRGGALASATPASIKFNLTSQWQGEGLVLSGKLADANPAIRLRYAITENGLVTAVKAGENKGETLHHDAVVRAHGTLTADASGAFTATVRVPREVRRSSSLLHVIAEDARGIPMAAATLACVL